MLFSLKVDMNRARRKSTVSARSVVASGSESDGGSDDGGKRKKRKTADVESRYRMKSDDDESFVQLCVKHFHEINNTATLKGPFVAKKQSELKQVWNKITAECNKNFKVSKSIYTIHNRSGIVLQFLCKVLHFCTKTCCRHVVDMLFGINV